MRNEEGTNRSKQFGEKQCALQSIFIVTAHGYHDIHKCL